MVYYLGIGLVLCDYNEGGGMCHSCIPEDRVGRFFITLLMYYIIQGVIRGSIDFLPILLNTGIGTIILSSLTFYCCPKSCMNYMPGIIAFLLMIEVIVNK